MEKYMKHVGGISQVFWYAKGKFEQNNIIDDLKEIMSVIYLIEVKYIDVHIISSNMMNICKEFDLFNNSNDIIAFINDISPRNYWKYVETDSDKMYKSHPNYDYDMAIIYGCLSKIRHMLCTDKDGNLKYDLDLPNFSILPAKKG